MSESKSKSDRCLVAYNILQLGKLTGRERLAYDLSGLIEIPSLTDEECSALASSLGMDYWEVRRQFEGRVLAGTGM